MLCRALLQDIILFSCQHARSICKQAACKGCTSLHWSRQTPADPGTMLNKIGPTPGLQAAALQPARGAVHSKSMIHASIRAFKYETNVIKFTITASGSWRLAKQS